MATAHPIKTLSLGFRLDWCEYQAQPLLDSLQQRYHAWDNSQAEQALAMGLIQVNSTPVFTNLALMPADNISVWLSAHSEAEADCHWRLLWQNNDFLAVHKPAQLPVSRTTRNLFNTLISLVRRHTLYTEAHLLHRLDAETSGLLLLAKNSHSDRRWKKHLSQLLEKKIYHALVWGNPSWDEKTVECWLAPRLDSPIRCQMHVVEEHTESSVGLPKLARGQFRVLQRFGPYSLIECELLSGRRHQIRAQLSHLGHPIIGDKIYSQHGQFYLERLQQELGPEQLQQLGAPHHLLHAYQLQLNTGLEHTTLTDPSYPDAWQAYLQP